LEPCEGVDEDEGGYIAREVDGGGSK